MIGWDEIAEINALLDHGETGQDVAGWFGVSGARISQISLHVLKRSKKSLLDRLEAKTDFYGPGGCWLWTGTTEVRGYGTLVTKKRNRKKVHRLAWELLVGPIPDGKELHHRETCPKRCLNPAHLLPLTHREHMWLHFGKSDPDVLRQRNRERMRRHAAKKKLMKSGPHAGQMGLE